MAEEWCPEEEKKKRKQGQGRDIITWRKGGGEGAEGETDRHRFRPLRLLALPAKISQAGRRLAEVSRLIVTHFSASLLYWMGQSQHERVT